MYNRHLKPVSDADLLFISKFNLYRFNLSKFNCKGEFAR